MVKKPGHVEIHVNKTLADVKMKDKINQNNQKKKFSQFPNISPQSPINNIHIWHQYWWEMYTN